MDAFRQSQFHNCTVTNRLWGSVNTAIIFAAGNLGQPWRSGGIGADVRRRLDFAGLAVASGLLIWASYSSRSGNERGRHCGGV